MEELTQKIMFGVEVSVRVFRQNASAGTLPQAEETPGKDPAGIIFPERMIKEISVDLPKKKRGKKRRGKYGPRLASKYTDAEIKVMRVKLSTLKYADKLTDMQVAALDEIGQTRTPNLSDGQREQIVNIYNEISTTKGAER